MGEEEAKRNAAADAAMERYAAGDDTAFAGVYDAVAPRLYAYLRRRAQSAQRAEDLMQQTFLQMHRARGRFIPGAHVIPWAYAIAQRLFIDSIRRDKRADRATKPAAEHVIDNVATNAVAENLVQARELAVRAERALLRLPKSQRIAFELLREEGFSLAQAAHALGTTVASVKQRAHRAYLALRAAIEDEPT